jgi:type I restriction enzyme S subunit
MRDLLLPRLISGKLRVDDLDIQFPPSMQDAAA